MVTRVIVVSGPVAVGKSTLASSLEARFGVKRFTTVSLLEARLGVQPKDTDRRSLQEEGERLDQETGGEWVAKELSRGLKSLGDDVSVAVDSVRVEPQIAAIRRAFGPRVVHIHLTATTEILEERYKRRKQERRELPTYADVRANPTESRVESLQKIADLVIDTSHSTLEDVFARTAAWLGLQRESSEAL